MNVVVFDAPEVRENLLPMTYTRPIGALRIGIDTIADKWRRMIPGNYSWEVAAPYLSEIWPLAPEAAGDNAALYVAGHVIPSAELAAEAAALSPGEALYGKSAEDEPEFLIARRGPVEKSRRYFRSGDAAVCAITRLYHIFLLNGEIIKYDFDALTSGKTSAPLSLTNTVIGDPSKIFIEPGASVEGAFLNTTAGPIYIGENAEVMEGSMLRGPIALCEHSVANMSTKMYPATTLGPYCKVGGELNNVVMQGYSNKAHDGFLGNAVIGEWCNLGAGCVASNLKNDYTPIKLWNYPAHRFLPTGLQFCGLIMGDHSKAGINTMFNTATVLGVGVNIHGAGFPRNFVASFSEGGHAGFTDVVMTKFFAIARRVMARRGRELTEADERMFEAIRETAENYK